jgi:hypothetical protein
MQEAQSPLTTLSRPVKFYAAVAGGGKALVPSLGAQ